MNKLSLIIIASLLIVITFLLFKSDKQITHTNIDSLKTNITEKNIKIDSLNKELIKLKNVNFDTLKIKKDIKTIDEKIKRTKDIKNSDTVSINDMYELQRFFSEYLNR